MRFDNKHWNSAFRKNMPKMIGICYRYTNDQHIAEDLAQEAFITAFNKANTFKGTGSFDAWLRQITINTALQHLRKKHSALIVNDIESMEKNSIIMEKCDDNQCIIEKANFTQSELNEAIALLPEHHRMVFNLYVIDQHTHAQIGEKLGISAGTSKSHLARARKKLQSILTTKAEEKQKLKDRKKAWLLFIFPSKSKSIDAVYKEHFINYKIPPQQTLNIGTHILKYKSLYATAIKIGTTLGSIAIVASTIAIAFTIKEPPLQKVEIPKQEITTKNSLPELNNKAMITKKDSTIKLKDSLPIKKAPVIIKKKRINRHPVVVTKPIKVIDSNYVE